MLNPNTFRDETATLQARYWPPVTPSPSLDAAFQAFVALDMEAQRRFVAARRCYPEEYGRVVHSCLATVYGYRFGYRDSPCYQRTDDDFEARLELAKLTLEHEFMTEGLAITPIPTGLSQAAAAAYLRDLARDNAGVWHPAFPYIATHASAEALRSLLYQEVVRNEVVDDEVALLNVGLQGLMKTVTASNLWDECGHGKPVRFHTYWLRRLLDRLQAWEALAAYRQRAPWYTKITSNAFNMLLWRPAYTYRKYGYFLITESWVAPHFTHILEGLERVGLDHQDITVYFKAHLAIDPQHGEELSDGFAYQRPALTQTEIDDVLLGAHIAIAAGTAQYDRLLLDLVQLS
jgi:hypothetical protein